MNNLVLALASGIIGAIIVAMIPQDKNRIRNITVLIFSLLAAFFTWRTALLVFAGESVRLAGEFAGFPWSLDPDPLGAVFALIASNLWVFAGLYSFGYMEGKSNQRTYYTFLLLALSVTIGVAFSGNLVTLYLFYELLTFATYPLVIHDRSPEAMKAGNKYILYSLSGAGAILIAMIVTYSWAGSLDFTGIPILAGMTGTKLNWLLALFVGGFGVKAAIMPLHRWLPGAMAAPTPVSALLHAVAVVFSGAYGIVRVVFSVFGHELVGELALSKFMPWLIGFTILMGVILALRQDVLKRRLAYQTISHLSYILVGVFSLQPWGLAGAIMHMISYSTLKVSFFFCAGIISEQTGKTKVSELRGVGWLLPKTMIAFSIATLGMIGMLPLNTFWGKYYLMKGSIEGGIWPMALVLVLSGVINAACFVPVIVDSFRGERAEKTLEHGARLNTMLLTTLTLSLVSLIVGFWPGLVWTGVEAVVNSFF